MRRREDCIRDTLEDNLGHMVIIFTDSGGASGEGFTGLLTDVSYDACRLVTSLPHTPPNPTYHRHNECCQDRCRRGCRGGSRRGCNGYGGAGCCGDDFGDGRGRHRTGGEVTIPIDHICAVCATDHY